MRADPAGAMSWVLVDRQSKFKKNHSPTRVSTVDASSLICGCPIWDLLCVSAPVWRSIQGPIARPPGFLPAPHGGHGPRKAGWTSPA
eukprot:501835-Prymnesium_polylepis.1